MTASVAVIIPAFQAGATLPLVLESVVPQARELNAEVIVVDSTGGDVHAAMARWPTVQVVALPTRTLPGRARNLGVARTDAEWLAFVDADAIPGPGWLRALVAVGGPGVDAVGGAVDNGTPRHPVGTAGWLLEFSEVFGNGPGIRHAVTCNLLVRRDALERAGGFAEELFPGEDTVLTFPLAQRGTLRFCAEARVQHLNRTGLVEFLRHQRRLGAAFPSICRAVDFPHGWLSRRPWSVAAGGMRLLALGRRVGRRPGLIAEAAALAPLLLLGLAAWTVGVVFER